MMAKFVEEIIPASDRFLILAVDTTMHPATVVAVEDGFEPGSVIHSDPVVLCAHCDAAFRNDSNYWESVDELRDASTRPQEAS
jgi:hypothetical protein